MMQKHVFVTDDAVEIRFTYIFCELKWLIKCVVCIQQVCSIGLCKINVIGYTKK